MEKTPEAKETETFINSLSYSGLGDMMTEIRPDGTSRFTNFDAVEFFPEFEDIYSWGGDWGEYILNAGYNLYKAYIYGDLKHQRYIAKGMGMSVEELNAFKDWTNMDIPSKLIDYAWALLLLGYDMDDIVNGYQRR